MWIICTDPSVTGAQCVYFRGVVITTSGKLLSKCMVLAVTHIASSPHINMPVFHHGDSPRINTPRVASLVNHDNRHLVVDSFICNLVYLSSAWLLLNSCHFVAIWLKCMLTVWLIQIYYFLYSVVHFVLWSKWYHFHSGNQDGNSRCLKLEEQINL